MEEVEAPPGLGEQVTAEEEKEAQMEEVVEKTAIEEPENKVEENVAEDLAENETEDTEGKEGSLTSSVTDSEGSSLVETWTLVDREDAQPEEKVGRRWSKDFYWLCFRLKKKLLQKRRMWRRRKGRP